MLLAPYLNSVYQTLDMGQSAVEGEFPNSANECKVSRNYASGLYNLALAQSVQKKPNSNKNNEADNGGGVNNYWSGKVVIDLSSGDEDDDDDVIEIDCNVSDLDVNNLEYELKDSKKELEHRIGNIREALECVIKCDSDESYDMVCYRIKNSIYSLWEVVLEDFCSNTDELVELAYGALKTLNNMFVSMSRNKQEEYRHSLSRLLLHVTSQNPPLFASDRMKEIEHMITSLESGSESCFLKDTDNHNKTRNNGEAIYDITELETNSSKDREQLLLPLDKDNIPSPPCDKIRNNDEAVYDITELETNSSKDREQLLLPLDKDNIPSPPCDKIRNNDEAVYDITELETNSSKDREQLLLPLDKDNIPSPPCDKIRNNDEAVYDITELETNSSKDREQLLLPLDEDNIPSPTRDSPSFMPPGNGANLGWPALPAPLGEDDVVMPYCQNALKAFSSYQKKFGQTSLYTSDLPSPTPSEDGDDEIGDTCGEAKAINAPIVPQSNVASSHEMDICSSKVVENSRNTLKVKSLAKSRDPRLRDAAVSNGPKLKKQKNGPIDFGNSIKNIVADGLEHLPGDIISNTVPFESIIKDIAVNPTAWLDIIKVEQQNIVSNSGLGEIPPVNVTKSSVVEKKLVGILKTPLRRPSTVKSEKSRIKPCDSPRTLHRTKVQKDGNGDPNRTKPSSPSIPSSHKTRVRLNSSNLPDKKLPPLKSKTAPHITHQSTKNLKKIAPPQDAHEIVHNHRGNISLPGEVSNDLSRPQNVWGEVEHLVEGFDEREKADFLQERARRIDEQKKMLASRKLCLVLDLDHTLLNSAKFVEVDPVHNELLRKKEEQDREKPYRHLFRIPHMGMWTKLRPGIWNFLEKASKLFELHLYTMGNKLYATEMAKLLDPNGTLFSGRVISRGDNEDDGDISKSKDLEGVLGLESGVVIIDDSIRVWPLNKLNLIVVERYIYFPCSRRQFGLSGPSLLEIDHDEKPKAGTLASSLAVIERIHKKFFAQRSLDEADVRNILASEQRKILRGCRIVFSRVFPIGEANPHRYPIWQMAQQFGATCTNHIDEKVTHVVANSLGTDKVKWARSTGRFVVHPGWVEASALLYRRANEQDFSIKP